MTKFLEEIFDVIFSGTDEFYFKDTAISSHLKQIEIVGTIQFNRKYKEIPITDEYSIQILFPLNYPQQIPIVKELKGRIPNDPDYHNNKEWAGFCFGVPADIQKKVSHDKTFKFFISEIVIPFLYAHSFYEQYNEYPWATRPHFETGLFDFYKNYFQLPNINATKDFLLEIRKYKNAIKGHNLCPCKSNKKFRSCHQKLYYELIQYYPHKNIIKEINRLFNK